MLIDTHCHLNMIAAPTDEVVARAEKNGVTTLITQGTGTASSRKAVEIAHQFSNVYATVGIHPEDMHDRNDISAIENLLQDPKVVGVGEVGLDYFIISKSLGSIEKEKQKTLFRRQIQLAVKYKKALVIHDREAVEDVLLTLTEEWADELEYHTVFHCCPADEKLLDFAASHHIYIGIDGDISWSKKKQRFIQTVPLELLVLETDSPFLVPLELKEAEKENEPKNTLTVRDIVAKVKETTQEEIGRVTTANARRLFSLTTGLTK